MQSDSIRDGAVAPPIPRISGAKAIARIFQEQEVNTVFGYHGAAVIQLFDALFDVSPDNPDYLQKIQEKKMSNNSKQSIKKLGSQAVVDVLVEEGVETMFGYLGGVVLPLFDKLMDAPIKFVIPRHEQGGCHMADAYARATGKVGVVIATSGPGATNLVTGLATAMMDSIPMVAITGQVRTSLIGNDAFQEADMTGITRPVTKHNVIVKDPNELVSTVREAFYIARTGRPGPVLIDLPVDMLVADCPYPPVTPIELPGYKIRTQGHKRQLETAAAAINASKRPVLYVGGGIIHAGASGELRAVSEKANIPVTTTLLGLGTYDQKQAISLDMLGMHGSAYANFAVQNADMLISIGARFEDRVTGDLKTFAPHAKVMHVDIDPASISKNVYVDIPVVGDAKHVLAGLLDLVEYRERKEWCEQIAQWKTQYPFAYDRKADTVKPQYVIEELCRQTNGDATVVTGVGQHQMWAAQFYKYSKPRQFISSGGLGTMGFGLPAAIGAQLATPDALVVDIDGDSSFNMTLTELSTAVQYQLPIKVILLNNGYMGMVRQWQELFYDHRYAYSYLSNPNFAELANAFGAVGMTVDKKEQVSGAIEAMLKETRPVVCDFRIDREENVWPMVPAGKSLHEMDGLDIFESMA